MFLEHLPHPDPAISLSSSDITPENISTAPSNHSRQCLVLHIVILEVAVAVLHGNLFVLMLLRQGRLEIPQTDLWQR